MAESDPGRGGECAHLGPGELVKMAEAYLRQRNRPEGEWDGWAFGYGEDVLSDLWRSVYLEVERRGPNWVVTKLDRRKEPIPAGERGFLVRRQPDGR